MTSTEPPRKHGIERTTLKYVVFAGNYRQYKQWETGFNISPGESMFVADRSNLMGVSDAKELIFIIVGTFHLRDDAEKVMDEARSRFPTTAFYRS